MSRDHDPTPGKWYEDIEREETFKVLAVDPDDAIVRVQWLNREIEEVDLDTWNELDLELAQEPEGWADDDVDEDDDEGDDEDWDDDEDDDWDDDEDDDYDDEDDEARDRE